MPRETYLRPALRSFSPYVVGKPIEEVRRELGLEGPIAKLASNENPLGVSPKALAAIRDCLEHLWLYPDDNSYYAKQVVARRHRITPEQVFIASGSVEMIELVSLCFLEPGDEVLTSERSFAIYYLSPAKFGAKVVRAPMRDRYWYDLSAMADLITDRTKVIFLANPNNPTGTMFFSDEFDRFMDRVPDGVLVVVDEAYREYIERPDVPDADRFLTAGRDVLILRTLSKAYGLAGLRVGYGYGPARLISDLQRGRFPFNASIPTQAALIAALDDDEFVARSRQFARTELAFIREGLSGLDLVIPESFTNFLLIDTPLPARDLFAALLRRGLIVRPMDMSGLPGAIRVSLGLRPDNERFVAAMRELIPERGA